MDGLNGDESLEEQIEKVTREDTQVESDNTKLTRDRDSKDDPEDIDYDHGGDIEDSKGVAGVPAISEESDGIVFVDSGLSSDSVGRNARELESTEKSTEMAHYLFETLPENFSPSGRPEETMFEFRGSAGELSVIDQGSQVVVAYRVDDALNIPEVDPDLQVSGLAFNIQDLPEYEGKDWVYVQEFDGERAMEELFYSEDMEETLDQIADIDNDLYRIAGEEELEESY